MSANERHSATKISSQRLFEEPGAPKLWQDVSTAALEARGYRFEKQGWNGDVEAVMIDGGHLVAAADPRGVGVARIVR